MTTSSGLKTAALLVVFFAICAVSSSQAEEYPWLKSQDYKSILVNTDFNGCEFIEGKLNETVKRTFSRVDIEATISNSITFKATDKNEASPMELLDEELVGKEKIILHVYGRCIRYTSGFIYQFDARFGIKNQKYSQALLYATPHHSVVGVDSSMGIDRTFRALMKNVVDDYLSANRP